MSREITTLMYRGHSRAVLALSWSPDSRFIASGGDDKTVQVWDVVDGRRICTYDGPSSSVQALAWSLQGTQIVSGY